MEKVLEKVREFKPDCILAIGGGSVLDTAKALWMLYEHPDTTWEQAFTPFAVEKLGKEAKHCCSADHQRNGFRDDLRCCYN